VQSFTLKEAHSQAHGYNSAMRRPRLFRGVLVCVLATLFALTVAAGAAAQEATPDDVLAMLDRVQAQLQQMSSDLDGGASQQTLVQDATGALAFLLSVEESLKTIYQDWPVLRARAESLYGQAGTASPETLRSLIKTVQDGLAGAREAAQRWKASGTSFLLEDVGAYPGEETWVSLSLAKVPTGGVASYDVTISYRPEVLRVTNVTFTRGRGNWKAEEGAVTIHSDGLRLAATQQPQELAQVRLKVTGQEKEMSVLSLREIVVYDGSGGRVPATAIDGTVRVLAGQAPTPTSQAPAPAPTPTAEATSNRVLGLSPVYLAIIVAVLALVLVGVGVRFLLAKR